MENCTTCVCFNRNIPESILVKEGQFYCDNVDLKTIFRDDPELYRCWRYQSVEPEPVKRIVQISFAGNQERLYNYFTNMGDLQSGDWVVCHTLQGYVIGRVVRYIDTPTKAEKWLVQRVDVEGHKARLERERLAREIEDMLG